jgi:hypothetical protein
MHSWRACGQGVYIPQAVPKPPPVLTGVRALQQQDRPPLHRHDDGDK